MPCWWPDWLGSTLNKCWINLMQPWNPFPIGHVRYANILTQLQGFQNNFYILCCFLCTQVSWQLRNKRNLKSLQFWPESLGDHVIIYRTLPIAFDEMENADILMRTWGLYQMTSSQSVFVHIRHCFAGFLIVRPFKSTKTRYASSGCKIMCFCQ